MNRIGAAPSVLASTFGYVVGRYGQATFRGCPTSPVCHVSAVIVPMPTIRTTSREVRVVLFLPRFEFGTTVSVQCAAHELFVGPVVVLTVLLHLSVSVASATAPGLVSA